MGKNNRARRAAKAKSKKKPAPRATGGDGRSSAPEADRTDDSPRSAAEQVARLFQLAPPARARGEHRFVEAAELELCRHPAELVRSVAATELRRAVGNAWSSGWQPAELVRHARRTSSAMATGLVRAAVAADHATRTASDLDPRWLEQIAALALPPVTDAASGTWIADWAASCGLGSFSEIDTVVEVLQCVGWIPVLEELIPPPGASTRRVTHIPTPAGTGADSERAMLGKIRALLAKAESTTFEAEAEALTGKAQELMTRHAIDAALLADPSSNGDAPIAIRVAIDEPYVDAKSVLLHVVAHAERCRAVFFAEIAASTVIGFRADVAGTELLYTSLLVQAQTALTNAAKALPAGSRQRSRSFRSSFLLAYAHRIGERLEAIGAQVIAEAAATPGRPVLPALRSRELAVDDAVEQRYGRLQSRRIRGGHDAAGWASGTRAADDAELVAGALPGS